MLAARILEDGAGKRTQSAPKGRAGVLPAAVLAGIVLAVVALGIGAFKFLRPETAAEPSVSAEPALSSDAGTDQPDDAVTPSDTEKADGKLPQNYDGTVEPFNDISVDVVSARVRVEIGDTYALRYTLLDDETVEQAGVEGQTLYLVSHNKTDQGHYDGFGEVCITVPADACLGTLQFSTVGGGVTVPELSCDSVSVDTTAGKLDFTGTADSVEMDSTSGSAQIEGNVTEQVRIDMVTGDIHVVTADPTVTAEGRTIDYNGQRMGGDSWSRQGSGCTLDLKTALGTISIRNP